MTQDDPSLDSLDRRDFLKTASVAGVGLAMSSRVGPLLAQGRSPNETVRAAVIGLNSRGLTHLQDVVRSPNAELATLCDVDAQVLAKAVDMASKAQSRPVTAVGDFRRVLDDKDIDAVFIAMPDHWHTAATVMALQAGKHVYVEKPASHDPHEAQLLGQAQRKYQRVVQLGTQQRSDPRTREVIQAIHEGLIGRAYYARAWYANRRDTIGRGKPAPVPATLDYELWQGPAPRTPYRDNIIHYNWHWFRRWGTGEICNNGTHEIDVARWALGVEYPTRVTSVGGRHHFDDDWEFYDTQDAGFEFEGRKQIVWQGRSCNPYPVESRSRGVSVHGTGGTVVLDRNGYIVYDLDNKVVKESLAPTRTDSLNVSADDTATQIHVDNFVAAIRTATALHAPIEEGMKSVLLCHLGNIAQRTGRALVTDARSGRISADADAMKLWRRDYVPGWEPKV